MDAPPADAPAPEDPRVVRVQALMAQLDGPEAVADPALQLTLIAEATALARELGRPKLWAYLRHMTGIRCEMAEPAVAIAAYQDALTAFGPDDEDRTVWTLSEGGIGTILASTEQPGTPGGERAIVHLERVVEFAPQWYAELLATLYGWRTEGDPLANWQRQVALLDLAAGQAVPDSAAAHRIALARNAVLATRPGGDWGAAVERSLDAHRRTLATLAPGSVAHAEASIELATAWLDRAGGDLLANAREAEALLHPTLQASVERGDQVREARVALLLARVRTSRHPPDGPGSGEGASASLHDAIAWCVRGRAAAAAAGERMLVASAEKSLALAHLALLERGEAASLAPAVAAARAAAAAFGTSPAYADEVRKLLQTEADAWLAAGRPADAIEPLTAAVDQVRATLARADSREGRLELAWRVRDSAALLAWCHATCGDAQQACEALERGRGLFWQEDRDEGWSGRWSDIVPSGGAVVVPSFAGPRGVAIVATRMAADVVLDIVPLPHAGAASLRALLVGDEPGVRLGGWLEAWCHRTSDPERFEAAIARCAEALHHRVAAPVVACLDARGIAEGAEVVWLPQGASSALPLQAATPDAASGSGLVDRVALRFAPSLASLERACPIHAAGRPVVLADPTGDLPFAPLEALWLAEADPTVEILAGAEATAEALLARLATRPSLLHVAGHGSFDLDDPFASALLLAGGERLTLDTLLPRLDGGGVPALVVLSACETSVARVTAWADELLGFPAALLAHGVGGVVGSLWTVADAQTALLMRVFHARRRMEGGAAALRAAQRDLRDATRAELTALFEPLRLRPAPIGPLATATVEALATFEAEARPFSHPVHWAGFALWGVAPAGAGAIPS